MKWKLEISDSPRYIELEGLFIKGSTLEEAKQNVLKSDAYAEFLTEEEWNKQAQELLEHYRKKIG